MKKFIYKLTILTILLALTILLIIALPGGYNHPLASIINKVEMLKSKNSPRVIFIGGSGLYCGLDSKKIENELKMPVVNMGVWIGFGLGFMVETIKPYINKGDYIIIVPEYEMFNKIKISDDVKKWQIACYAADNLQIYNLDNSKVLLELFQLKAQSYLINLFSLKFSRLFKSGLSNYENNFNKYGDSTGEAFNQKKPYEMDGYEVKLSDICLNDEAVVFYNEFLEYCKNKGVSVYWMFAPYPANEYKINERNIERLYKQLKNDVNIELLCKPEDFIFNYDCFSNTVYHLNDNGKKLRTDKMINKLKFISENR